MLCIQDLARLQRASKATHTFFKKFTAVKPVNLMELIKIADWDRAELILARHPEFMLTKIPTILRDDTVKEISPLQYALYIGDYHALVMFQQCAQKNKKLLSLYENDLTTFSDRFNFQKYFVDIYEQFVSKDASMHQFSSEEEKAKFNKFWCEEIGNAQKWLAWAVKEMCLVGKEINHWHWQSTFNAPRPSTPCIAYGFFVGDDTEVKIFTQRSSKQKLGETFALIRGDGSLYEFPIFTSNAMRYQLPTHRSPYIDMQVFSNLHDNRQEMIERLLPSDLTPRCSIP